MKTRGIASAVALVTAFAAGPAFPQDAPGTSEFQVNTTTRGFPTFPAVAQAGSGDFVVVWNGQEEVDFPELAFAFGVFGQRYDAAGRALGAEFQVTRSVDYNVGPSTAIDSEGGFVVVWTSSYDVHASRFSADGMILEEDTELTPRGRKPVVAGDAQGNWLALWEPVFGGSRITGRRFDAAAEIWEPGMAISPEAAGAAGHVTLAGNERGDLVAAWLQGGAVVGRRLASSGELRGATFQVNESPLANVDLAVDVDEQGGFAVVWRNGSRILIRRFDAAATPLSGEVLVSSHPRLEGAPAVALAGDDALVAWAHRVDVSLPSSRGPFQLSGRRYDGLGVPLGIEFPLTHLVATSPALAAHDPEGSVAMTFLADRELVGRLLPATLRTGVLQLADDLQAPFSEVAEERESRAVHVLRTGGNGPLTVEYFTADGAPSRPGAPAAAAGHDYVMAAGTLVFAADEFVQSFPLEILEDDVPEGNELLTVGLRQPTGGALLGEPAAVEVVVYDDDAVGPGEGLAPRGPELRVNRSRAGEQRYPRIAADAGGDFLVVWQGRDRDDWDVFGRLFGADGVPAARSFPWPTRPPATRRARPSPRRPTAPSSSPGSARTGPSTAGASRRPAPRRASVRSCRSASAVPTAISSSPPTSRSTAPAASSWCGTATPTSTPTIPLPLPWSRAGGFRRAARLSATASLPTHDPIRRRSRRPRAANSSWSGTTTTRAGLSVNAGTRTARRGHFASAGDVQAFAGEP